MAVNCIYENGHVVTLPEGATGCPLYWAGAALVDSVDESEYVEVRADSYPDARIVGALLIGLIALLGWRK